MLDRKRLLELLHYEPETGVFTRLVRTAQCMRVGDVAGRTDTWGYRQIGVDGRKHLAHRLAWLYVTGEWPAEQIDHVNGDRSDNRIVNLRLATGSQNQANMRKRGDNTSGYKGVAWNAKCRKWQAYIGVNGRRHHLGLFNDPAEAHAAYISAAQGHFGEYARAA
jgi:hypothetical protein